MQERRRIWRSARILLQRRFLWVGSVVIPVVFLRRVWPALVAVLWWLSVAAAHAESSGPPDPVRFALAVENGQQEQVAQWLAAGLPADYLGDRIGSGLMIAAWQGNVSMMDLFVRHGAQIDLVNRYDEQALQLAAWRGHLAAVRWLLDHGASVRREGSRWSALHYAAFANRPEISRLLLERGAEVNARAPNGSTVLMMAAREGHIDLARQLLAAGADPQASNEVGDTALSWAMRQGHYSLAQAVSSQNDFAQAARLHPPQPVHAPRSVPAPPELEELLRQIRLAEAAGQPTAALRRQLLASVEEFKRGSQRIVIGTARSSSVRGKKVKAAGAPGALVITARRPGQDGGSGERAELVYHDRPDGRSAPVGVATSGAVDTAVAPASVVPEGSEITEILDQMQRARARGQPVETLRQKLYEAVARARHP